jgi:triosephosphate isomerase
MNDAQEGAYTGEIAGIMLKEAGAQFVLLGHSERRKYFHETDELINRKVLRAIEDQLLPILCVGETFEEKEAGKTHEILKTQLENGLKNVKGAYVIAYEPIWAIGTGKTATAELANATQGFIREIIGPGSPILYGGSVNGNNIAQLTQEQNIDGVLVGGASLSLESFIQIIQNSL